MGIDREPRWARRLADGVRRLGWPEASVGRLLGAAEIVSFAPGRVIYREGSAATRLFWMLDGVAKLFVPGAKGRRVLVSLAKPGALLGSHLVVGGRRLDCAIALTPIGAAALEVEEFQAITAELPAAIVQRMTRATLDYSSRAFARAVRLLTLDLRGKLALALLDLADGFGVADADGRLLKIRLTHEDLAELTGISRARVTEVLKEFAARGAIVRRGRDLVVRPEHLREIDS